ncbi:hypothetical protein ABMA27_002895 [Loxostege sticticalis]|uniref:Odorant receptor n=1 Tax=Loxostege sticticalis TaxID=481309 RepID=A0ABR3HVB4_LOXSC
MDLRYMKQLRNFLHLLDCWPHRLLGEDVKPFPLRSIRVLVTEWIIILVGGVIFLRANINERDFIELGQTYLTIFLTAFGIQRVTISLSKSYQELMNDFVLEIHLFHHRQKSKYSEYMYQHIHKICTVLVSLMYAEAIISSVLFNVTPLYKNYKKGMFSQERPSDKRFELSVYYSLPFVNQETNLFAYIVVSIFNVTLTFDCGLIYCGLDWQPFPAALIRSSVRLLGGRPTLHLPVRGLHSRIFLPYRLSVLRAMCTAHRYATAKLHICY